MNSRYAISHTIAELSAEQSVHQSHYVSKIKKGYEQP